MVQHQKQLRCREGRKIDLKYTDFTELKKIAARIYPNCTNYSSLFSIPSNYVSVSFISLK